MAHASTPTSLYRFEGFELDEAKGELRRAGQLVGISSQSFALLGCLLRRANCIVTRDELSAELWAGVAVSDGSLRQAIWEVRQVLGDDAERQQFIKTVRGSGYRFVAPLERPPVEARGQQPQPAPQPGLSASRFFGRDAELKQLESALAESSQAGRACLVLGAPGMGKSRLVRELMLSERARPLSRLEGHADVDGVAPPFWPFLQLLDSQLGRANAQQRARYQQLAPLAFRMLDGVQAEERLDELLNKSAAQHRFQLLTQLGRLFVAIANDAPGVMLLEDLQWADEGTLALLAHFAPLLPQTRTLLLITCRIVPAKENRALGRALEALARGPLNARVELRSLSEEQVGSLLELYAPGVSQGTCREVHMLGGGNPLLTLELSRLMASTSQDGDGSFPHEQLEVRTVIRKRLMSLPESTREVVLAASVHSGDLSLGELARLLEQPLEGTLARVDPCIDAGLLTEDVARARYRFAHPLTREVAYAALPRDRRARLHRLAGEHIEGRHKDASVTRLNELAHHFFLAASEGVAGKAVVYATRCAERSYAATAYQDAVSHYDRALSCADLSDDLSSAHKLEIELSRGEALRAAGLQTDKVNQLFLQLSQRADALGEGELFARAVLGYTGQRAMRYSPTRFPTTVDTQELQLLERALEYVGPQPSELRVLLLCSLVNALSYSTDRQGREQLVAEALRVAAALDIPWISARALGTKVYACAAPDCQDERLDACNQLLALSQKHGLRDVELDALVSRVVCLYGIGEARAAEADVVQALELGEQIGTQRARARAQLPALMRAFCAGDLNEAERLTQLTLDAGSGDLAERAMFMIRAASLRLLRYGVVPEAVALQETLLNTYPEGVGFRCVLASAYATLGNAEGAREQFDWVARDGFRRLPEDINWLAEMGFLADAAAQLNDKPRARLILERLLPHQDIFTFFVGEAAPAGPMAHWLAELSITLEQYDDARAFIARAYALNETLGAQLFTQYVRFAEARLIFQSQPRNERERNRARALLDEVCVFADARGCAWLRASAERLGARYGTAPREPAQRDSRPYVH